MPENNTAPAAPSALRSMTADGMVQGSVPSLSHWTKLEIIHVIHNRWVESMNSSSVRQPPTRDDLFPMAATRDLYLLAMCLTTADRWFCLKLSNRDFKRWLFRTFEKEHLVWNFVGFEKPGDSHEPQWRRLLWKQ